MLLHLQLLLILALFANSGNSATDPSSVFDKLSEKDIETWHSVNRDGDPTKFPLAQDFRLKSSKIADAHEVLRKELQLFLDFKDAHLGFYLSHIIQHRSQPFKDEYGQEIRSYKKVFRFIWEQYNETVVNNYAVGQFDKDKLDLCSVARFLSHRFEVKNRKTIMKRMNDALDYKCHPCSPYKRKEHGETIVADYYSSSSADQEEVSPEESLILCNKTNPELQVQSQQVTGLIWQESSGGLKWAHSCDYHGSDIGTKHSSTPEQCGQDCVNNNECTHFTWNSGTCFLKHFKSAVTPGDSTSCVSGWIKRHDAQPQMSQSSTCFYYVENRPDLMTSSQSGTSEVCRDSCVNKEQCAHFAWITGWCYHMLSSDSTGAVDLKKTACGLINDRVLQQG